MVEPHLWIFLAFPNCFSTILQQWLCYKYLPQSGFYPPLPDSLVSQPAGITLLVPILIGSLQLLRGGNDSTVLDTGLLCLLEVQGVPCGYCSVVEHDAWKTQWPSWTRLLEGNQPLHLQRS